MISKSKRMVACLSCGASIPFQALRPTNPKCFPCQKAEIFAAQEDAQ